MTQQVSAQHWRILSDDPVDNSTVEYDFQEIREQQNNATIPLNQKILEFHVGITDRYILPANAYLSLRVQLVEDDGSNTGIALGQRAALLNSAALMFSRCEYLIDNHSVEVVQEAGMVNLIRNLLEYSEDHSRSAASDQGWELDSGEGGIDIGQYVGVTDETHTTVFKDSGDVARALSVDATTQVVSAVSGGTGVGTLSTTVTSSATFRDNPAWNSGYYKRSVQATGTDGTTEKFILIRIPLNRLFGICQLDRVSIGSAHTIRLTRAPFVEATMASLNTKPVGIHIRNMSLWFPVLKPSEMQAIALNAQLASSATQRLSFEHATGYVNRQILGGSISWEITNTAERVNKVVMVLIPKESFISTTPNDARTANKAIFKHAQLQNISIKLGGFPIPQARCI